MATIDVEWKDTEPKAEEEDLRQEKEEQQQEQTEQERTEQEEQAAKQFMANKANEDIESLGLADMIVEGWNEVAVNKGYEPILDKQAEFYRKHSARFEAKYLGGVKDMIPEVEFAAATALVLLPKYLKHQRINKEQK